MSREMTKFWRQHLWMDLVVGLLAALIAFVVTDHGTLHTGDATNLYIAVVSASAALGAFAVTPIAIVLALTPGPRLKALLNHQMDQMRRAMGWTVAINLIAIAVGLIGIAIDSADHAYGPLRFLALAIELAALLAVSRLVWFFVTAACAARGSVADGRAVRSRSTD